mmetsp:Transcript_1421/g.4476  ORF Transcript_1421/g.4476 Transcript_1421/m.4476 type:complete len:249 (-) Transcript_1421:323-1069(-)
MSHGVPELTPPFCEHNGAGIDVILGPLCRFVRRVQKDALIHALARRTLGKWLIRCQIKGHFYFRRVIIVCFDKVHVASVFGDVVMPTHVRLVSMRHRHIIVILDVSKNLTLHKRRPRPCIEHRLALLGITCEYNFIAFPNAFRARGVDKRHPSASPPALHRRHSRRHRHRPTSLHNRISNIPIHRPKFRKRKHPRCATHKSLVVVLVQPKPVVVEDSSQQHARYILRLIPRSKKQRRRRIHHPVPKFL